MTISTTPLGGRQVLFLMAAHAEYGEHLQQRFEPVFTGVGPVESAIATAHALTQLRDRDAAPDLVVCLGSAGSRTLEQGAVYQVASVSYRDMDASPLGFEKGATPFLDLPAVLDLPYSVEGVPAATLSTGGHIISGAAYGTIAADMVDMETFAVLRACMVHGVPLVGFRGISDGAADLHHYDDWTQYLHVVDENLATAVDRLGEAIAGGLLER